MSKEIVFPILLGIGSLPGVRGIGLMHGRDIIFQQLPLAERLVYELNAELHALFSGYSAVERKVSKLLLGFGKNQLLVIKQGDAKVAIIAETSCDLDGASTAVEGFLREHLDKVTAIASTHAAPVVIPAVAATVKAVVAGQPQEPQISLETLRQIWLDLLGKVMGQAQSSRLLEREFTGAGLEGESIGKTAAIKLGNQILGKIPNRARRGAIEQELEQLMSLFFKS